MGACSGPCQPCPCSTSFPVCTAACHPSNLLNVRVRRSCCSHSAWSVRSESLLSLRPWFAAFRSAQEKALSKGRHGALAAVSRQLVPTVVPAVQLWLMLCPLLRSCLQDNDSAMSLDMPLPCSTFRAHRDTTHRLAALELPRARAASVGLSLCCMRFRPQIAAPCTSAVTFRSTLPADFNLSRLRLVEYRVLLLAPLAWFPLQSASTESKICAGRRVDETDPRMSTSRQDCPCHFLGIRSSTTPKVPTGPRLYARRAARSPVDRYRFS